MLKEELKKGQKENFGNCLSTILDVTFETAYDKGAQDVIKKACGWLKAHNPEYNLIDASDEFIGAFRKAMEE